MDGSFQDLDGESMEAKVDEFFRDIFKMLKFFQQKQSKAEQEIEKIAGKARQRPGEDEPKKQENPIILLCSTVMEQIKEFKVFYVTLFQRGSLMKSCNTMFCVLMLNHYVKRALVNRNTSL